MLQKNDLRKNLKNTLKNIKEKRRHIESLGNLSKLSVKGVSGVFFVDKPVNLIAQYNNQIVRIDSDKLYLSLFENTTNFDKLPINNSGTVIGNEILIDAHFNVTEELICSIYVIFYDNKKILKSFSYDYNGSKLSKKIDIPKNSKYYRVAIKLEGTGEFQNIEMNIKQQYNVTNMSENFIVHSPNSKLAKYKQTEDFKQYTKSLKYYREVKSKDLKIASILDEFSHECFKYDCDLLPISKDNWKEEISEFGPDFLFVESSWQGNNGTWAYEVANLHVNEHRTQLKELVEYCKENNIKTVFWDKEGLENFDFFKEAASYFDFIFTADENNIDNFKNYTKNNKVSVLPFAAQPQIHNPINKNRNFQGEISFSGSYYNNKHDDRKKDIEQIIKPTLKYGVNIYDRYFATDTKKFPNNQWPEEYKENIVGNLTYPEMIEAYKNYNIFINVNSVQNSKYMFARRVFELLASRTMVLSGPSIGVKEFFDELVPISNSQKETEDFLKIYLKNPALREKIVKEGSRLVLQKHAFKNRLQEVCKQIGIEKDLLASKKVTLVSATQRDEYIEHLYKNIKYQNYKNIEVIIVLNKDTMNKENWEKKFNNLSVDVTILKVDEKESLGHCLNEAIKVSTGEIIAKFDDDDYYAPNYLLDMVLSMEYSNADLIGKSSHYLYFEEKNLLAVKTIGAGIERYSDFVAGATLVFTKKLFDSLGGFSNLNRGEDSDFLKRTKEKGYKIYSNDEYNYCCIRRSNKSSHTWKIDDNDLLKSCKSHSFTTDYITPVTI